MKTSVLKIVLPLMVISTVPVWAQSNLPAAVITIDATQRDSQPDFLDTQLWGRFQEIRQENSAFHDLVRNGDFEHVEVPNRIHGWTFFAQLGSAGEMTRVADNSVNEDNPHSMRLNVTTHKGRVGIVNSGLAGLNVLEDEWYDMTFHARTEPTNKTFGLVVSLESADGQIVCARATIPEVGGAWREYKLALHARHSYPAATMVIAMPETGTIWFDQVSLHPRIAEYGSGPTVKTDVTSYGPARLRAQAGLEHQQRGLVVVVANESAEVARANLAIKGVTVLGSGRLFSIPTRKDVGVQPEGILGSASARSGKFFKVTVSDGGFDWDFEPHSLTILCLPTSGETR